MSSETRSWTTKTLNDLEDLYWTEIAAALRSDGYDPHEEHPPYQWLVENGYSGMIRSLRREHGLTPSEFYVDILEIEPEDEPYWPIEHEETVDALEAYLEIVGRYEDRHGEETTRACLEHYSAALAELVIAMADVDHEVLGVVYEQLGMQSDAFGQHFTPHAVSDALAAVNFAGDDFEEIDPPLTIHDPACGSGRMLISVARHLDSLEDAPPALYSGQDKSPVCAKMTALNLALARLPGRSVLGDSLKMERRTVFLVDPSDPRPITIETPSER